MAEVLERFVALEGLDGAGTTTQLRLVSEALAARGVSCHATSEPTEGPYGREARRALRREIDIHPLTLAFLFAADRNEHLRDPRDGILKHLAAGTTVITDRYLFSSLAYQSVQSGFDHVFAINSAFPVPRDVVFLDTPLEICQGRLRERGRLEIFDEERVQRDVLARYRRALDAYAGSGMRVHRVDGSRSAEAICADIFGILTSPGRY